MMFDDNSFDNSDNYTYGGDLFGMFDAPQEEAPVEPEVQPAPMAQAPAQEQPVQEAAKEPAPQPEPQVEAKSEVKYEPIARKSLGMANILVVGVGGGGCNAVNNMVRVGIKNANFVVMNTDMQALHMALVPSNCKVQLGVKTTMGLGAGSDPEIGKRAAEESRDHIKAILEGVDLLFITAGMGGGTGTGAAPVVAEIAHSMGILTVAVVTKPFEFEGSVRTKNAEEGLKKLRDFVDTLLVIPNQKLLEVFPEKKMTLKQSFECADSILAQGVQGVSNVITNPELINLDFADVRTVLSNKGLAHMGIGYGKGDNRVLQAVRSAVYSPLVETTIEGATAVILNIIGGDDMLLDEINEACAIVRQVIDPEANFIFGSGTVPNKQDIEITIIATGFADKRFAPIKPVGSVPPRVTKSLSSALAAADNMAKSRSDEFQPMVEYPERPNIPTPRRVYEEQPKQHEAPAYEERRNSVNPSRMDVSNRNVPHFLRRLHGNNDESNN